MASKSKLVKSSGNKYATRNFLTCAICGRTRGIFSYFMLCRICLRDEASDGNLAGVEKKR